VNELKLLDVSNLLNLTIVYCYIELDQHVNCSCSSCAHTITVLLPRLKSCISASFWACDPHNALEEHWMARVWSLVFVEIKHVPYGDHSTFVLQRLPIVCVCVGFWMGLHCWQPQ